MSSEKRKTKGTPDNVDIHVGKRLRVRRSLLGFSQEKLSEHVGITFQQIQKYECGLNRISAGRLYQFSRILNVPVSYFFENIKNLSDNLPPYGFADSHSDQAPLSPPNNSGLDPEVFSKKETIDLVRTYYSITDPDVRQDFMKFMKSLADKQKAAG